LARIERAPPDITDQSATAAFLHDIGKLVLASQRPAQYERALEIVENEGLRLHEAERKVFSFDHADTGGYLLNAWKLPQPIADAVKYHHRPNECLSSAISPLAIVYTANLLDHLNQEETSKPQTDEYEDPYLSLLPLQNGLEEIRRLLSVQEARQQYVF
jgi:HD-like signal output (HDOD) protein